MAEGVVRRPIQMTQSQIIEGTREQLIAHIGALPVKKRYRVLVLPDETDDSVALEQARLRQVAHELFAEADSLERQPGKPFSNPEEAQVAEMIAAKHRRNGLQV